MNRLRKWNRKGRKAGIKTVFLLVFLAAVLWGISLWQGEKLKPYAGDIQIRYHGQGVSRQAFEQMREAGLKPEIENFPEIAAWNVEYYVEARNPILDFKQEVTCVTVNGQFDQVVRERLVAGTYGFADDAEGCVISSRTAWELFGSTNVTGEWISVKGKRFIIRGVTAGSYPMVILAEKRLGTEYFSNVSFSLPGYEGLEGLTEEMMMRFGLPGQETRINGSFYYAVVRLCSTLPGWALLVCFLFFVRHTGWQDGKKLRSRSEKWRRYELTARRMIIFLIMAGSAVFLIWYGFRFPGDFIPTRWSDFSFYTEKFRQIKENIADIAMLPKNRWDVKMIQAFSISLLCAAEAAVLLITTGSLFFPPPAAGERGDFPHEDSEASITETV